MTTNLRFEDLQVREFRNLRAMDLRPAPRLNVISGDNGQGKTSVLEALYLVATSRSFRAERHREIVREGAERAQVKAVVTEDGHRREQRATLDATRRQMLFDGKKPETLAAYATRTPIVVFHPGDLLVVSGPAAGRRTLLDRIALYVEPASADHRSRYVRAMRSRQVVLEERGPSAVDLGPMEQIMARHGSELSRAREEAAQRLAEALGPLFGSMGAPGLALRVRFVPGGSLEPEPFLGELASRRERDRRKRSASFGPHRDDLEILLDGRSVRRHASQGQQRILTLAIKAAELSCIRDARSAHPVLLLDDVSSELDADRTGAVFRFLGEIPSQVFVTTTRPDLLVVEGIPAGDRADFRLAGGALEPGPAA